MCVDDYQLFLLLRWRLTSPENYLLRFDDKKDKSRDKVAITEHVSLIKEVVLFCFRPTFLSREITFLN